MVFVSGPLTTLNRFNVPHHSVDFAAYFLIAPPTILLKPDPPRFTIVDVNPAYLQAVNATTDDLLGLGILEAFPANPLDPETGNVDSLRSSLIRVLHTKQQDILPSQKYDIPIRGTGCFETRYWKATNSPITDHTGEVAYIAHIVLDITQAIKLVQQERFAFEVSEAERKATVQMEERLRQAIDSASLGTWSIDADNREFIVSPRFKEFFGFAADETLTFDDALSQVDVNHRHKIIRGVEIGFSGQHFQDVEFAVNARNEVGLRWLRATGRLYAAQGDKHANLSGTVMDITKQKLDDQRKNDFIAMVSHELKTPLTSLNGYIQLMQCKLDTPGGSLISTILDKARKQVSRMITLIEGLLNVSRFEAGKIQIQTSPVDLADLIRQIEVDSDLGNKSHKIIFVPMETTWVDVDQDKIAMVITNLISNAMKYSPVNTTIQVSCIRTADHKAVVSVQDQGIGIKQADQPQIFDRFYRVESNQTASIAGFGIGLYICKEIVERHGGRIWVESTFGMGSTFSFSIPAGH